MRLAARYELGRTLGAGGMGTVRLAEDTRLDRTVAIKVLHPMLAADPGMRRRFETEGRAAARITHPNVVQVYDSGEDAGVPFLVMEYVEGPTLADEIARGPIRPERARQIALGIAHGLGAAHAQGVTHCDVKPANVVLVDDVPKVTDFGIAKTVDGVSAETTGLVLGTPAYVAPERIAGGIVSPASDVFSTGVLLAEMLTGQRPEVSPDQIDTGALDSMLAPIVRRATSRAPEDRFADGGELANALEAAGRDSEVDAPTIAFVAEPRTAVLPTTALPLTQAPTPTRAPRTERRRSAVMLLALALLVVLLGVGAAFALGAFDNDTPTAPAVEVPEVTTAPTLATTAPTLPPDSVPVVAPTKGKAQPKAPKAKGGSQKK